MTDEDMNEYRFQNESEILNELAWTSIEPEIQVPRFPLRYRAPIGDFTKAGGNGWLRVLGSLV